jgi:Big-like domain-containing protein
MTRLPRWWLLFACLLGCLLLATATARAAAASTLTITVGGDGAGSITSGSGIDCTSGTCTAPLDPAKPITLTAAAAKGSVLSRLTGTGCTGTTCTVPGDADAAVTATFDIPPTITSPTAGLDYAQGSAPVGTWSCPADASCAGTLDGKPFTAGGQLSNDVGSHTLSVTGSYADGATLTTTASYTVSGPPPAPVITAPVNGAAYNADAVPKASFKCAAAAHTTLQSCTAKVDGSTQVQPGDSLPSSAGPHTLTVIAKDADGLSAPASSTYTVNPPPTCTDIAAATSEGVATQVTLNCSDPNAAVTYRLDSKPRHGTIAKSGRLVTYTPAAGFAGIDQFTYHGVSVNGSSGRQTVTITVLAPPTAQISAPAAGQVYTVGQLVPTRFGCADDPAGPGLRSCVDSGGAADGSGVLNTSSEGHHTYTVTATSKDGQTGQATIEYTVVGRLPQVVIAAPVDNASYLWTAVPAADFSCVAGQGSTVQSCKATIGGQAISDHDALPNSFGAHTLTVTATDADGLSATASATYTIISAVGSVPPVRITAPAQGGAYRLGQVVTARYSCLATTSGPALKSCVGTVRAGRPINTRTLGTHTFSVSATNDAGTSTTETVSYSVIPTSNRFTVTGVRAGRSGAARLRLALPGPGSVKVAAIAWNLAPGGSRRHVVYGFVRAQARRGGPMTITVTPNASGRALLRVRGVRPAVSLVVSYAPTGAKGRVVHLKPMRLR